jgi:beta-mannosidase
MTVDGINIRICSLLIGLLMLTNKLSAQTLAWEMYNPLKKEWVKMGTHGSVQEYYIQSGELPDPFWGENETKFGWIEDSIWKWRSTILISEEILENEFIELVFPLVDTYAEISLNGSPVAQCTNAFKPYLVPVKNRLKPGENSIEITFYPPVVFLKDTFKNAAYTLPAPNDVHPIAVAPYVRKPQYQFGWDWALRMNTIGLLKPAKLIAYSHNELRSVNVQTRSISESQAQMEVDIQFAQPVRDSLLLTSTIFGNKIIPPGADTFSFEFLIDQPKLWWPNGQGEPFLYSDELNIRALNNNHSFSLSKAIQFGVRTSELVMEKDQWGTSYVMKINGRPVFCKGADYIPQDIFPSRVSDDKLRDMVKQMTASHFNMVRIWGGGYYPDEAFYNACDEAGIMIWQDFMFACAMYPGSPEFLRNVKEEVSYQLPRISAHPSVVLFNGNNEVDVAWKNWGFQIKYNLYGKDAKSIEQAYDDLFKKLLPEQVQRFSSIPYIHTSPLSNWGKEEFYNHGSQHYWGVWHGKDPLSDFGKKIGRFNAEYGFQSFPEMSTIQRFADSTQWRLDSPVMKHHQKSYVGNGMIAKHSDLLFGKPTSFEEFVYFSQLTQAEAVGMAVAGHRLDAPRCMGTLYWQLNDCWPAPTWSGIDYYGNWKALQYRMKKDYESVTVLRKENNAVTGYFLHSDLPELSEYTVTCKVFHLSGKLYSESTKSISLSALQSKQIDIFNKQKPLADFYVEFTWKSKNGDLRKRAYSQVKSVLKKPKPSSVEMSVVQIDETNKQAVLRITSNSFLRDVWIYSRNGKFHVEDNFFDLLPGNKLVKISFDELSDLDTLGIFYR